jgi:hypothetical protein
MQEDLVNKIDSQQATSTTTSDNEVSNGGKIKKNKDSLTGADQSSPSSTTLPSGATSSSKPLPMSPKKYAPASTIFAPSCRT